ncbi:MULTISPECIES: hypothetical protein [unclassified Exiguobacterium]|uniref:hypothetical protein n=1 Tax=unclassified Exiguobacterium TaxID=2644629 RepID=UPI001BE6DACF|nr:MULTISPECIES: hypothetical protein [unclassified Exiguobacterium]
MGQKQNEDSILKAYNMNGRNNALNNIQIILKNGQGDIYLENVNVELGPNPPKSSNIRIEVQDEDEEQFKECGFKETYFSKEKIAIKFSDISDHQIKKAFLFLKPQNTKYTLSFEMFFKPY